MKTYTVTFNCLIPCQVTTTITAKDQEELKQKIINNDFQQYRYKTIGKLHNINNVKIQEQETK